VPDPSVVIIVLNWNGRKVVLRCLQSLKTLTYPNCDILVVDNGSEDGSAEAISMDFPEVQVVALPENRGYAEGNNAGLEVALKKRPDWILFLNNDTEVAPDLIDALISGTQRTPGSSLFGPKIYYSDGIQIWYAGGEINFFLGRIRHRGIRQIDSGQFDEAGPTDFISGCCLLIQADLAQRLGGFDARYPMYMEDVDLCYRARQIGMPAYYLPEGKVWHHVSSSLGGELSIRKVWLKWYSSMRFLCKYAKPWHWATIFIYQILYYTVIGPWRYTHQRWLDRS
jgi:GT2 family glycosyltransferase